MVLIMTINIMKILIQILFIFLLFSCATIKEYKLDYLKSKYESEYQICEDILTKKVSLDSILKDINISSNFLIDRKKWKSYVWITEITDKMDFYKLIEIEKSKITVGYNKKTTILEIIYTITSDKKVEVIIFSFEYEDNIFKIYEITLNPNDYYQLRRPKVEKYYYQVLPID